MWSLVVVISSILIYSVQSLETVEAALTSTIELPCSSSQTNESINPAKIIWIRDDHGDIISFDSAITVRDNRLSILSMDSINRKDRILRINHVREEDQSLYRCIQGDLTLKEIHLNVLVPPEIVAYSPKKMPVTVAEGRSLKLSCRATGRPPPDILWHVNGLSRPGTMKMMTGHNVSQLILHNVSRFDARRIDCSATNPLSTVNRQFLFQVEHKPILSISSQLIHTRKHESVTVTCQVCAQPSVTVFDFFRPKQSVAVSDGVQEKFDQLLNETCKQLTIMIHIIDESVLGSYVCRAKNSMGTEHVDFVLKELSQSTKSSTIKTSTQQRSLFNLNITTSISNRLQTRSSASNLFSTSIFRILFFIGFIHNFLQ